MKVVKVRFPYLIFCVLLTWFSDSVCQTAVTVNLDASIKLNKNQDSFGAFLNSVSQQTGVVFSFSSKKIAPDKILNLTPGSQSLGAFLKQIHQKTGLYYKVVGTHIIFLEKQPPVKEKSAALRSKSPVKSSSLENSKSQNKQPGIGEQRQKVSQSLPVTGNVDKPSLSKDSVSYRSLIDPESKELRELKKDTLSSGTQVRRTFSGTDTNTAANIDTTRIASANADSVSLTTKNKNASDSKNATSRSDARVSRKGKASNFNWFIGTQVSRITGLANKSESLNATGLGLNVKIENIFSKRFSYTLAVGFDHFMGTYRYPMYTGLLRDTTIKNFTIAPIMAGLKYYFRNNFYLSAELGPALKASSTTRTKLALSPSAGILVPLKNNGNIDLALRFSHIVQGYGLLESTSLQRGGYSFLSLRAAYGF